MIKHSMGQPLIVRPSSRARSVGEVRPRPYHQRVDPSAVAAIRELVGPLAGRGGRVMLGITGPPGAGKSTLAEAVVADYGPPWVGRPVGGAVTVPMDGFHLSNVELERLGLADRKGAPETFDGYGFAALLERIRAGGHLVYAPMYSRVLHESVGGVIPVESTVDLVVVEGNYLLLPDEPWSTARRRLDLVVYLDAPDEPRIEGLLRRQEARGLGPEAAHDWVWRSDEANARLIAAGRDRADAILVRGTSTG
jgi:pantothenate kinase